VLRNLVPFSAVFYQKPFVKYSKFPKSHIPSKPNVCVLTVLTGHA